MRDLFFPSPFRNHSEQCVYIIANKKNDSAKKAVPAAVLKLCWQEAGGRVYAAALYAARQNVIANWSFKNVYKNRSNFFSFTLLPCLKLPKVGSGRKK